jgi:hypothetical protein
MAGSSLLVVLNSLRLERFVDPSDDPRLDDAPASERAAPTLEATSLGAATGDLAIR